MTLSMTRSLWCVHLDTLEPCVSCFLVDRLACGECGAARWQVTPTGSTPGSPAVDAYIEFELAHFIRRWEAVSTHAIATRTPVTDRIKVLF